MAIMVIMKTMATAMQPTPMLCQLSPISTMLAKMLRAAMMMTMAIMLGTARMRARG